MNMKETKRILAAITAIYPAFVKDRDPEVLSRIWQQVFASTPYPLVNQALTAFLATDVKGFPPTPGALNTFIRKTRQLKEPSEDDAWAQMDRSEVNSVIAACFKRSWRARHELAQEFLLLPEVPAEPLLNP